MFKSTSQNTQRRITRSGKSSKASRLRKLDKLAESKALRASRLRKLKNLEEGEKARAANLAMKAKLRAEAADPAKAESRAAKIATKQSKRMAGVVVETKKQTEKRSLRPLR